MCGQGIRVDASTGRCALGHRVAPAVVAAAAASADVPTTADLTAPAEPLGGYVDERIAAFTAERTYNPYAEISATEAPAWDKADDSYAELLTADAPAWNTADGSYAELPATEAPAWDAAEEPTQTWDAAEEPTQTVGSMEDFLSWDDEADTGVSALDYDTAELPLLAAPVADAPVAPADLLDELGETPSYVQGKV